MNPTSVHGTVLDHPVLHCPLDDPPCVAFTVAVETAVPPVPGQTGRLICEVIGYGHLAEDADRLLSPGVTVTVTGHTANPQHRDWAPGRWLEATCLAVDGDPADEGVAVDSPDTPGVDLSGITPPW
jgi:hypothetical protein